MGVRSMHIGTILYFAAALVIGITLLVLAIMLNTQISSDCNNTVKHSILGVLGLGLTLIIVSVLMFAIDSYCSCETAVGLFSFGLDLSKIQFFASLTILISIVAISLGVVIESQLDEQCGKNVNKNLAKYIWIGGIMSFVLSIVILTVHNVRKGPSKKSGQGTVEMSDLGGRPRFGRFNFYGGDDKISSM
jgi:protein-S-isoprenylcysteine O-methyltransferase Ste14